MKLIIVVATSRDGFITKGEDPNPSSWTSVEDHNFYKEMKSKHKLLVFGKNTYGAANKAPNPDHTIVVLTRSPEQYADKSVPGILEFISATPQEFVEKYQDNYKTCLILGGSYVYTTFLEAGLIDEMYITVEPQTHKSGIPFIGGGKKIEEIVDLPKPEITKLNDTGTVLKHYVLKK